MSSAKGVQKVSGYSNTLAPPKKGYQFKRRQTCTKDLDVRALSNTISNRVLTHPHTEAARLSSEWCKLWHRCRQQRSKLVICTKMVFALKRSKIKSPNGTRGELLGTRKHPTSSTSARATNVNRLGPDRLRRAQAQVRDKPRPRRCPPTRGAKPMASQNWDWTPWMYTETWCPEIGPSKKNAQPKWGFLQATGLN